MAREVVNGQLTMQEGVSYLLNEIPEVFVKSLPMGILIGSLLVFDRLSKNSEITALRASGISIYRMALPIVLLGILGSLLAFWVNENIVPTARMTQEKIKKQGKIVTNNFTYIDRSKSGALKQVLLIEEFDTQKASNIRIITFFDAERSNNAGVKEIYAAPQAIWNMGSWALEDGVYYKLSMDGFYEKTDFFDVKDVQANSTAYSLLQKSLKDAKQMNLAETKDYVDLLLQSKHLDEARYYLVRYHQKYSQTFAAFILGLVGVILGIHPVRSSRFIGYTVGMGVVLLYYFIWPVTTVLGNIGLLSPAFSAWLPNIVVLLLGLLILKIKDL